MATADWEERKKMHNRTFRLISVNGKAGSKNEDPSEKTAAMPDLADKGG